MLRWLILAQAVVYLLVMPMLRARMELGYYPPLFASLVAIAALVIGAAVVKARSRAQTSLVTAESRLRPRPWFWAAWLALAIAYCVLSLVYGLLDRRLGSEYMAELYATFPLPVLAILRIYELLLVPVVIIYAFSVGEDQKWERVAVILITLASLPFMGLANSRGRLIVIVVSIIAFIPADRFVRYLYRNLKVILGGAIAIFAFLLVSVQRAAGYGSINDYLFSEVYTRLDGLNLVVKLREANLLSYWGQFDWAMAGPLISKVPFLEAAQNAKLLGRTSTKQYVIQDLLRSTNLDDSNSIITDPLYFGGIIGLFVGFFLLGWGAGLFDRYIRDDRLMISFGPTVAALAFGTGVVVFENDYVGILANMILSAVLIAGLLLVSTGREKVRNTIRT